MVIIGAVFARANSKSIKNKNLLRFKNKSLVGHAVNQAYKSKMIKKVFISSDSNKIINEAKKYKAIVPFKRPKLLSSDTTPHIEIWRHLVRYFRKNKIKADYVVDIPTTAPLRKIEDINKCIKIAIKKKLDMVVTVSKSQKNPYFNMLEKKGSKLKLIKNFYKTIGRRQDAPQCYDLTTVCYVFKPGYIMRTKDILSGKVGFIDIPKERAIDIDDSIDYKIAKTLSK